VGGVCAGARAGLGDSCVDADCNPELRCSAERICVIPLPVGASCSDQICEIGSECRQGVCFNLKLSCP
jgi:hypothetical protein